MGGSSLMLNRILTETAWEMDVPGMFGAFHLIASAAVITAAVIFARLASALSQGSRIRLLAAAGWLLLILEIYKQLFLFYVVNGSVYDWWFFPFQLCSIPMYLCILLPLFTDPGRGSRSHFAAYVSESFLTFMAAYTFVSAVSALLYPEDFLRRYVTLTLHGFVWHGILLFISLVIIFSRMADLSARGFIRATILFLLLCPAAVIINIYAEPLMNAAFSGVAGTLPHTYAAMFYLNPYHSSPQPFIGSIQAHAGIPAGLLVYVLAIIALSGVFCAIFRKLQAVGPDHVSRSVKRDQQ